MNQISRFVPAGNLLPGYEVTAVANGQLAAAELCKMNNCDPAFALARAEKIRKTIAERPVETSAGSVSFAMSFGLLLSQEWGYMSVAELLHEADTALYVAKAAGRNCVKLVAPRAQSDSARELTPEPAWRRR